VARRHSAESPWRSRPVEPAKSSRQHY
jgi:hypothetical protein